MSVKQTVENVYLRQDAVQLTRKHFWRLLGMVLIVAVITNLLEYGLTALGDLLMVPEVDEVVSQYTILESSEQITSTAPLFNALADLFTSPKFLLFNLVYMAVIGIVTNGLSLGRTREVLAAGRGGLPKLQGVFGMMKYCLKGWGVELWTGLKASLWMLPGIGLIIVGSELIMYEMDGLGSLVIFAGMVVWFVLMIQAFLRYMLAILILADEPDRGIRECVTFSKGLMKGHKWQCAKLGVPIWLKIAGSTWLASLIVELLMSPLNLNYAVTTAITTVLVSLATSYFTTQLDVVHILFYLKRREPAADAPVSYWLKDHTKDDPSKAAPVSYWLREHTSTDIETADEEAAEPTDAPAESPEDSPEDISPENTEEKENPNEEPVC